MSEKANIPYKDEKAEKESKETKILKFELLKEILDSVGLTCSPYESKKNKIDSLVEIRGDIAHGKEKFVDKNELYELFTETIKLIRKIKTNIFEAAEKESYKRRSI